MMPESHQTGHAEAGELLRALQATPLEAEIRPQLESCLRADTRGAWLAVNLSRPGDVDPALVEFAYQRAQAEVRALPWVDPGAAACLADIRAGWERCVVAGLLPWTPDLRPLLAEGAGLWTAALIHDHEYAMANLSLLTAGELGLSNFAGAVSALRRSEGELLLVELSGRPELASCVDGLRWYLDNDKLAGGPARFSVVRT